MKRSYLLFAFLLLVTKFYAQKSVIEKGVLDIREWDFSKEPIINLVGEYEFFWNKLLTPDDFQNQVIMPDSYIFQPSSWDLLEINGKRLPAKGVATLKLVIFANPSKTPVLMLRFQEIMTSYKVWFNDKLICEVGKVDYPPNFKPGLYSQVYPISINKERNVLIIQIANFNYRKSAIDEPILLGLPTEISKNHLLSLIYNLAIMAIVLLMAFYHLGLYLFRRKNKLALLFGVFSFLLTLRFLTISDYPLNYFLPDFSWYTTYRIAYLTFYLGVPLFFHFFFLLFNEFEKYRIYIYASYILGILFSFSLLFSSYFFSSILFIYQFLTLVQIIFLIYKLIIYIIKRNVTAYILGIGILTLLFVSINDVLYYNEIINTTTLFPFGMAVLVLSQSLSLAKVFTNAFNENEKLTIELDYKNKHLEELVKERTKQIEQQKEEILQKNEELLQVNEELLVQKEEIMRQRDMLEEQNTMINDSINYASLIQKALLPDNEQLSKYFFYFIVYRPRNIVSGDFYWFTEVNDYVFFAVGDCTGHGVPGAFVSIISLYLLNNIVNQQNIFETSVILEKLDEMFYTTLHKTSSHVPDGLTISLLRFDKNKINEVLYSISKQSFILMSTNKEYVKYRSSARQIGYKTKASLIPFEQQKFSLQLNDTLYIYSDGVTDLRNNENKKLGTQGFISYLLDICDLPLTQQKISLDRFIDDFLLVNSQRDDITIVGLKIKPYLFKV